MDTISCEQVPPGSAEKMKSAKFLAVAKELTDKDNDMATAVLSVILEQHEQLFPNSQDVLDSYMDYQDESTKVLEFAATRKRQERDD